MVSSTDTIRHAASGGRSQGIDPHHCWPHTKASKLSAMSSVLMSTPYHMPPEKAEQEGKWYGTALKSLPAHPLND